MKGRYVILRDTGGYCYTTNSIYWHCFFRDRSLPGDETCKLGEKPDWTVVTFLGEVIYRFKQGAVKQ